MVRLHDDLLTPLDAFIADRPDLSSRPEAIRLILQDSLIGLRYIEMPEIDGDED